MNAQPNCPCDEFVHPRPLTIDAGLTTIPRQIATFDEFRHAMLSALATYPALRDWRARGDQDLGVMLLEMWAYVCDSVSFYDETIAHESYLRTARCAPSVRKLVGLLGYRPRPAVAAVGHLAVKVDGRQPVLLPAGTAFRSAAFGAEPPQVYELAAAARVHPLLNGWGLVPTVPTTIPASSSALLLSARDARVLRGDHLVVQAGAALLGRVFTATSVLPSRGTDGSRYVTVTLDDTLPLAAPLATSRLLRPTARTTLWTNATDPQTLTANGTSLALAGAVPQLTVGGWIIAGTASARASFRVTAVSHGTRKVAAGTTFTVGGTTVTTPDVRSPSTTLTVSPGWPATLGIDPAKITIEYGLQDAGTLTALPDGRIAIGANLTLRPPVEAPPDGTVPANFLVEDADGTAQGLTGGVNFTSRVLTPNQGSGLLAPLDPPATVYANVVTVTRGETVPQELLGVGDASVANQTFTLKKKPLTYVSVATSAEPNGVRNALTVWVRDVAWTEVPSFFDVAPDAHVYIVRQDDAGESSVTFGDSIRGARLPSGAAVVARYRFGAGAATPPAGGITQLGKPVKGVIAVKSPVPPSGGDDAQPSSQVRTYAPRSALLFGRAVSITDMQALAAGQPGVRDVQAQWSWDPQMQLPTVRIWFIGPATIAPALTKSLRAAVAPSTPITAASATPVPATLVVDVRVDRTYQVPLVKQAVVTYLTAPATGLLSPERIGVGKPFYRSVVLAEILAVPGVRTVTGLVWQGSPFEAYGYAPGNGSWFDVSLTVHATEEQNG